MISDGEREALSDKNVIGCDADFRFWEGRDDFSVSNKSVVKVTFKVMTSISPQLGCCV